MEVYYFSEMAYFPAWEKSWGNLRNEPPSRLYDPVEGHQLYHRFLDEYLVADEVGLNLMINEHHSTPTCGSTICTIPLAILARQTRNARLLALGMLVAHRNDPVRIAEEFAMIDVISGGRLEIGMVKGGAAELHPANLNPTHLDERFWEAHDLIIKALSTQDGPFRWEGRHFHYRLVNVWPRPYQTPHPPVWMPAASPQSMAQAARMGYVAACLNTGFTTTRLLFDSYRKESQASPAGLGESGMAYLALVGIGATQEEGYRRAGALIDYIRSQSQRRPQYANPIGLAPPAVQAQVLATGKATPSPIYSRDGRLIDRSDLTVENMIEAGTMFAGTPDQVYRQIEEFYRHVGGFGRLIIMSEGAWIEHKETIDGLRLFGREVLPRLKDLKMPEPRLAEAS
jgi:alkanesulfonate monooxygenase SsuD/methylene tetrahydromethanopterin reductase-like flavin-dependent oxidoreductase (luciferase family)